VRLRRKNAAAFCAKTTQKEIAKRFRVKSSFSAFKPTDNSVLGKDKGYREKETPAPQ
jgi:hypothetical protein